MCFACTQVEPLQPTNPVHLFSAAARPFLHRHPQERAHQQIGIWVFDFEQQETKGREWADVPLSAGEAPDEGLARAAPLALSVVGAS